MKRSLQTLSLMFIILLMVTSSAFAADGSIYRIHGTVKYVAASDTYGILGDNDKMYHPMKRLDKDLRKDGLAVVVQAKLRDDITDARLIGKATEILRIEPAEKYIGIEEREALKLLLARMDAFNTKSLTKLQEIDVQAKDLSKETFDKWLTGYGNFTLRNVEILGPAEVRFPVSTMEGWCVFSRDRVGSMAISGNTEFAIVNFTMTLTDGVWRFKSTSMYIPAENEDPDELVEMHLQKGFKKFGVENLAKWRG